MHSCKIGLIDWLIDQLIILVIKNHIFGGKSDLKIYIFEKYKKNLHSSLNCIVLIRIFHQTKLVRWFICSHLIGLILSALACNLVGEPTQHSRESNVLMQRKNERGMIIEVFYSVNGNLT